MPCLTGEIPSAFIADPHFVELSVPERGFGNELDAMVQFYLEHGEELRIGCFRTDRRDRIVFCFRDPRNAAEFARRFSGEICLALSDDNLFFP